MHDRPDRTAKPSFVILGMTRSGKPFRPSDWAERLCGVMASFRPGGIGLHAHLTYSPYVMPGMQAGVKCVHVNGRIDQIEPKAYAFLISFARDNDLQVQSGTEREGPLADL
jgi:Protein of unknown function (DUF3579)